MAYNKTLPAGQAAMAASNPVVIANNQSAVPVSFTGSTGVATQTTLAALNAKLVTGTDIGDVTINNSTGAAAVNIQDGGNTITVDGTVGITANSSVNVAQINGVTTLMGAGNTGTGSQRVTIASDQAAVATKAASGSYASGCFASGSMASGAFAAGSIASGAAVSGALADGALVTLGAKADAKSTATDTTAVTAMQVLKQISASVQAPPSQAVTNAGTFAVQATLGAETTKVIGTVNIAAAQTIAAVTAITNALPAGTNAIGKLAANSGVDIGDVDILSIAAGDNNIGNVDIVTLPGSSELIFRSIDLDETEEEVKATAALLYGWYIFNAAAATQYVKLYNATAANVTVGTTTPVMTIPIPAGAAANVEFTNGIAFATALTAAATTGVADADTGAPAANSVIVNLLYK